MKPSFCWGVPMRPKRRNSRHAPALAAGPVTWIGVAGDGQVAHDRRGLTDTGVGDFLAEDPGPDGLITAGSIVLELRVDCGTRQSVPILRYGARDRWLRGLMITYHPGDSRLVVDMVQGQDLCRTSVHIAPIIGETDLRLTLSWDAPAHAGLLSVEHLEAETLHQAHFRAPLPLPHSDAERMVRGEGLVCDGGQVLSLGIALGVAPVGLAPGLASGSLIDTPNGPRAIETLAPGDPVLTAEGAVKTVLHVASRQVPAFGLMRPLHLRAPFLGLTRDVILAPHQRLIMTGGEAEYLYGEDAVMIHARHLRHFHAAGWADCGPLVRYHAVLLDSHECLSVQGLWVESLFVGPLVPDILRTTVLSEMAPLRVPIHKLMPTPSLTRFEARNLVTSLYA